MGMSGKATRPRGKLYFYAARRAQWGGSQHWRLGCSSVIPSSATLSAAPHGGIRRVHPQPRWRRTPQMVTPGWAMNSAGGYAGFAFNWLMPVAVVQHIIGSAESTARAGHGCRRRPTPRCVSRGVGGVAVTGQGYAARVLAALPALRAWAGLTRQAAAAISKAWQADQPHLGSCGQSPIHQHYHQAIAGYRITGYGLTPRRVSTPRCSIASPLALTRNLHRGIIRMQT